MVANNGSGGAWPGIVVSYKACRRNHAIPILGYVFNSCGAFASGGNHWLHAAMFCQACDCHHHFHRRVEQELPVAPHHQLSGINCPTSNVVPPPPINPQPSEGPSETLDGGEIKEATRAKKRVRTKFTLAQKDQMRAFANKLGWKLRGNNGEEIRQFCSEVGITHQVLKVWINNNKRQMKTGQTSLSSKST
ncbi:unnamed protein product [Ilex paraguariensis]|uniref:ZF-HD dimerization-type domain-containing protein n=1 Tax=Ilex paraguariensis TaxID=185542 RepID=A0ABC8S5M8_9AQUA